MSVRITLRRVGQRYAGRQVLDDVDLSLEAGETVGIAGPSAAGKSTLARLLTLHEAPHAGDLSVDDERADEWSPARRRHWRRALQLVPQDPGTSFVPHWPTWRVVAESALIDGVDPAEARARASAALRQVGLGEPQLRRTPLQLSGGERRRVAIARAILADSRLLVFDESFSGLDGPRQGEMLQLLLALRRRRGLTLITISHDLRLLRRIAERALILENGRIVEDGPVDRVLSAPHSSAGQRLCAAEYRAGPFA